MDDAFKRMAAGMLLAVLLVLVVMVMNFQSWADALIVIGALPVALAGVVSALFITGTTFNVPSLMGAILVIGVATANSILLVAFANERLAQGLPPKEAAREAGRTRLRPVLMTAAAMILGMLPMASGLGEGGEQNAPLGRAVVGGLAFATIATLLLVPALLGLVRERFPRPVRLAELPA
jgi:multidrug efflux pump subunit AcrB